MVKLGFYIVKKRYKHDVYKHEQVCLRFPKELHDFLRCLRNHQLEIKATREGNITHIMLIDKQEPLEAVGSGCTKNSTLANKYNVK